jgi:small multidrug resistance pump
MCWVYLCLAIALDVAGTVFLKLSNGMSRFLPSVLMFLFYGAAFIPLSLALRQMPVGMVYAIWSALGTALVVAIGMFWFHEPVSTLKCSGLGLIIVGVIVLNLAPRG